MWDVSGDEHTRLRRLLQDSEERMVAQQELVERLRAGGDKAASAEEILLRTMKDALHQLRQRLREVSDRT